MRNSKDPHEANVLQNGDVTDRRQIEHAMALLEGQRGTLDDAVLDIALAPLRAALAKLREDEQTLRQVTVLFADIVGSTALVERLDPEDAHSLLDGTLRRLGGVVAAYRGRVLRYMGDGLLAVFGAEGDGERAAEDAVLAGLEMVRDARLHGPPEPAGATRGVDVRVGIDTGTVLLGGGVEEDNSVMGLAVNTAARMEQAAPTGGVRIGQRTHAHVRRRFDCIEQIPASMKGLAQPVRSYLVQGMRASPVSSEDSAQAMGVPLTGRDAEMAALLAAFERARAQRRVVAMCIVGEGGLGKSRLLHEFERKVKQDDGRVVVLRGSARSGGNGQPYGLLRDMLLTHLAIRDSDAREEARAKVVALNPGFEGEAVAGLLGLGGTFGTEAARTLRDVGFAGLVHWLRRQAEDAPVVLMLDDLHWADEGSLAFLRDLASAVGDRPLLLVCTSRPALEEAKPGWLASLAGQEPLSLHPLGNVSGAMLADQLLRRLGEVPTDLREMVVHYAAGNPYFAEEIVGMLLDNGTIETVGDRWRLDRSRMTELSAPTTLVGVLQARIDALTPVERRLLQQASVVGHVFWDEALTPLAADAPTVLDGLLRRELICRRQTTGLQGTIEYTFKHELLRQVVYSSVLKRDRRDWHRSTAQWLSQRGAGTAGETVALVAEHHERAGDRAQAAAMYSEAASAALDRFAIDSALAYVDRALALAPTDADTRFKLVSHRAAIHHVQERHAERATDIAELDELAQRSASPAHRAHAAASRIHFDAFRDDWASVIAYAPRAIALARVAGDLAMEALVRSMRAQSLMLVGDLAEARAEAGTLLELACSHGYKVRELDAQHTLGRILMHEGCYGRAGTHLEAASELARSMLHEYYVPVTLSNLGELALRTGNFARALHDYRAALATCRAHTSARDVSTAWIGIARTQLALGDDKEALASIEQALQRIPDHDSDQWRSRLLCLQSKVHAARGEDRLAAARADDALRYAQMGRDAELVAQAQALVARLALASSVAEAHEAIAPVLRYVASGGHLGEPLEVLLTCAEVLRAAGDPSADQYVARANARLMQETSELDAAARERFLRTVGPQFTASAAG